jgi:hypothetical protein
MPTPATVQPPPTQTTRTAPRGRRLVLAAMLLATVLICAYWLVWFGVDRNLLASSHAPAYYTFENAFPLADGWLALALVLGIVGIWRGRPSGLLWTLLAAGAGIYLGCMDVLFDLQNHIYTGAPGADPSAPLIEAGINVLTFALGIVVMTWAWRNRAWFLAAR